VAGRDEVAALDPRRRLLAAVTALVRAGGRAVVDRRRALAVVVRRERPLLDSDGPLLGAGGLRPEGIGSEQAGTGDGERQPCRRELPANGHDRRSLPVSVSGGQVGGGVALSAVFNNPTTQQPDHLTT